MVLSKLYNKVGKMMRLKILTLLVLVCILC